MQIRWGHFRRVAAGLAGLVVAVAFVAPAGQFVISLAEERGWYKHPDATVAAVIGWFAAITATLWFHWIGGGVIGFAIGAWLDAILKRPIKTNATSNLDEAKFVKTILRLQFFGDHRYPQVLTSENIANWFAYHSPYMQAEFKDADGNRLPSRYPIPPTWAIFLSLDKPSAHRQAVPTFSNPELLSPMEVRTDTARAVVVTVGQQIPAGVVEVALLE